jgi:hypothetical protein
MRAVAQILLTIIFIITLFLGLVTASLKFQLLNYNFWNTTFQKHNVYQNLATVSKDSFEHQITKEGGNKDDVRILTDLITPTNVKETVDKNLKNFLGFANGKESEVNVYLPIDKIPRDLLSKSIAGLKTEMTLQELLTKFNYQDREDLRFENIANSGQMALYLLIGVSLFILLILTLLFLLVESGERFLYMGVAFVLSGGLMFFVVSLVTSINTIISNELISSPSIAAVIAGTMIPPVITEIAHLLQIIGFAMLPLGVVLFFIKKPKYNNSK